MLFELQILLFSLTSIYAGILSKPFIKSKFKNFASENKDFSVIIAFKNEAENLPILLSSLKKIEYSNSMFEVILIDDNSTDSSFKIASELISNNSNFRLLKANNKVLPRKKGALQLAIENSNFSHIVFTDADSQPNKNWLNSISNSFNKFDFIIGFAPLFPTSELSSKYAAYENYKNNILNLISVEIGIPTSAIGRNLAIKKDVFFKLGGYYGTMEKETGDDDLLLRQAIKNKIKIGFVQNEESVVNSYVSLSWKEIFVQKARHVSTSHNYLLKQKLFILFWHLLNSILLFSPLLFFVEKSNLILIPFVIKLVMDRIVYFKYLKIFNLKHKIATAVFFDFLQIFLLPINFINSFIIKTKWKD